LAIGAPPERVYPMRMAGGDQKAETMEMLGTDGPNKAELSIRVNCAATKNVLRNNVSQQGLSARPPPKGIRLKLAKKRNKKKRNKKPQTKKKKKTDRYITIYPKLIKIVQPVGRSTGWLFSGKVPA